MQMGMDSALTVRWNLSVGLSLEPSVIGMGVPVVQLQCCYAFQVSWRHASTLFLEILPSHAAGFSVTCLSSEAEPWQSWLQPVYSAIDSICKNRARLRDRRSVRNSGHEANTQSR